jgi:hypothetical protein
MGLLEMLTAIFAGLVAAEIRAHSRPFAAWLIRRAVRRLPESERAHREEAWLADLNDTSSALRQLWWAIGCRWAVIVLPRERSTEGPAGTHVSIELKYAIGDERFEISVPAQSTIHLTARSLQVGSPEIGTPSLQVISRPEEDADE